MLIYGPFGSRIFLSESHKNSGNIGLLKNKPKRDCRTPDTWCSQKSIKTIIYTSSIMFYDKTFLINSVIQQPWKKCSTFYTLFTTFPPQTIKLVLVPYNLTAQKKITNYMYSWSYLAISFDNSFKKLLHLLKIYSWSELLHIGGQFSTMYFFLWKCDNFQFRLAKIALIEIESLFIFVFVFVMS